MQESKNGSVILGPRGIIFDGYVEADPRAVAEARRYDELHGGTGDLRPWASTVIPLGAQVVALGEATGGITGLASTVAQMAERAEQASAALAADVARAATTASEAAVVATKQAAEQAAAALVKARQQAAADLAAASKATSESMQTELVRLLGGEDAPVARAVSELVRRQMEEDHVRQQRVLADVLDRATAAWDADNPASGVASLERRLAERQDRQHAALVANLSAVQESVAAVAASAQTQAAVASAVAASPAKGRTFEEQAGSALESIAAAMGGTYTATGDMPGAIRNCRKGDGVIELPNGDGDDITKIVVEMTTTGSARKWGPYLDEAIRNRCAHAAIGVVPTTGLVPGGSTMSPAGPGRIVMAFDPEAGGHSILGAAVTLLALHAQRDLARQRTGADHAEVDARLADAERQLGTLAETLKAATGVRTGAAKVVAGIEACQEALARSLGQARAALRATAAAGSEGAAA
ncbi:MAG: hypothetical protein QOD07_2088 [Frankiaceae bacterium]|jgi:hypothetical protein|nr:hypothetical protein [Frankiaceae bacterium]